MQTKYSDNELKNICFTQKLLEKSSIMQFVWKNEKSWPVKYASNNVKNILGYSSNDFTSGKILYANIIHPADLNKVTNEVKKYSKLKQDSFEHKTYRLIAKNGKIVWVKDITHVSRDKNNNITHFEGIIIDITEQKETELTLKATKEKYETVANYTYDWEYWIDANNNFVYVSPSSKRITGYTPEEFYKNKNLISDIIHPDDRSILETHKHSYTKSGKRTSIEFRIITKDKKIEWIGHVCQNVFDKAGKYLGIRGNNRLITKRKLAEDQLKKNELKLKETNAAKDKFFSIIAHDLRGPFNSMFGFSELLMTNYDKYDTEKPKKYLSIIFDGIRNTYKLLDDLLLWSRSQQGTIDFNPEPLNLFLVTDDTCNILEQSAKTKSIRIVNNIPENFTVLADVDILSTIIRNLISNSIKFTKNGGKIKINANYNPKTNKQKFVEISVKDNGIGMSKEKQSKLFDIKENVSTYGTEDEAGTGLGLILCKEFVKKHKGEIWLESEKNVGTTFYFTIPTSK